MLVHLRHRHSFGGIAIERGSLDLVRSSAIFHDDIVTAIKQPGKSGPPNVRPVIFFAGLKVMSLIENLASQIKQRFDSVIKNGPVCRP